MDAVLSSSHQCTPPLTPHFHTDVCVCVCHLQVQVVKMSQGHKVMSTNLPNHIVLQEDGLEEDKHRLMLNCLNQTSGDVREQTDLC